MAEVQARVLLLSDRDSVAVALGAIGAGQSVLAGDRPVIATADIPKGHKIALFDIEAGAPAPKFGQMIGHATKAIRAGEHVHVANLGMSAVSLDYGVSKDYVPAQPGIF